MDQKFGPTKFIPPSEEEMLELQKAIERKNRKWDDGKLKYNLILPGFLELMAEILTRGEVNHPCEPDGTPSWQLVEPVAYENALIRHLQAYRKGEIIDPDPNMPTDHMGNVAVNAMFLWWFNRQREKKMKIEVTDEFKAPFGIIPSLRASIVPRWSIIKTTRRQSLAEHNYNVSVITKYLCEKMEIEESLATKAAVDALTHDYDEIYTGDIPSPAKTKEKREVTEVTGAIIKLADALEAWLFIQHNCADSDEVKIWIQENLYTIISNISNNLPLPSGTITEILSSCVI